MGTDRQYREVLGYYARGRDEGYPLDPDIIPNEGGDECRADFDRFLARVKAEAWAEGAYAGYDDCKHDGDTPNPYIPGDQ